MAAYERSSDAYLNLLKQQGEELNFFQAIRLLERAVADVEKIRFKVVNTQAFRPNFIEKIEETFGNGEKHTEVTVNGYGVTGMQGPMPQSFSELLYRSEIKGVKGKEDPHAFLDIFHDRLISLLYQIKKRFNPLLFNEHQQDHELYHLFSGICGFEQLDLFDRLPTSKAELSSFAPIMANRRLNHSSIVNLLKQYFNCEVTIFPNQGAWRKLPAACQSKLTSKQTKLSNVQRQGLGKGIGLGKKYWDNQAAIGLDISVADMETFRSLLPAGQISEGEQHQKLKNLLTFLGDAKYQFHVRLLLNQQTVPTSYFSSDKASQPPLRLGQTSWLKTNQNNSTNDSANGFCNQTAPFNRFVVEPGFVDQNEVAA